MRTIEGEKPVDPAAAQRLLLQAKELLADPRMELLNQATALLAQGAASELDEEALDREIAGLEHDVFHGRATPETRTQLTRLRAQHDAARERAYAEEAAEDYWADKLEELDDAPDAATATDAVARLGLLDGRRLTRELPPANPPGPLPTASKAAVLGSVAGHVTRFFAGNPQATPFRVLLNAETGARKTGLTLRQLHSAIEDRKAAGLPYRAIMLAPAHKLGREIETRARAAGINAALFQGRGDPRKPDQPCRNLEAVSLALQVGADIRSTVCGPAPGGARCAYRDTCGYFASLNRAKAADLVIAAHNFLFDTLPTELRHDVAWVIVDEDFAPLADRTFELELHALAPDMLEKFPVLIDGKPDPDATAELGRLYGMVIEAVRATDGYLSADVLRAADITATSNARIRALTWARKRDPQMRPGMDLETRKAAARMAMVNSQLGSIASLTYALDAILDGKIGLVSVHLNVRPSGFQTVLTVRGQLEPAKWLSDLPVLMLNATGRIEDVRRVFPDAALANVPRAAWEHCKVDQVTGSFGRSALSKRRKRRDKPDEEGELTKIAELCDFIKLVMLDHPKVLVITPKALEHHFNGIAGVTTAHHGAIAGLDEHADVDALIVIGGAFPNPEDVASIAAARGGGAVPVANPERVTRAALLSSGEGVEIPVMAYADPAADAVHRGIYDASVIQAIGRVRPLDRTASNPALVYVFGNIALPFPVASVRRWRDMKPDRLARMVAGEAAWSNTADMHRFRPDLFPTERAAAHARERSVEKVKHMREAVTAIVRNDRRPWSEIAYQPSGQGHKSRHVWCPKGAESAIRQAIVDELGEPVHWDVRLLTAGRKDIPIPVLSSLQGIGDIIAAPSADPVFFRPEIPKSVCRTPPDG